LCEANPEWGEKYGSFVSALVEVTGKPERTIRRYLSPQYKQEHKVGQVGRLLSTIDLYHADCLEAQNAGAVMHLKAVRKLGEMLQANVEQGRPSKTLHGERFFLKEANITEIQSHRWQKLAEIPEGD
jgi:hypothetical protein